MSRTITLTDEQLQWLHDWMPERPFDPECRSVREALFGTDDELLLPWISEMDLELFDSCGNNVLGKNVTHAQFRLVKEAPEMLRLLERVADHDETALGNETRELLRRVRR